MTPQMDSNKSSVLIALFTALGIILVVGIIAGSITYYYAHQPPTAQCESACGMRGMMKSYDPIAGCVCR